MAPGVYATRKSRAAKKPADGNSDGAYRALMKDDFQNSEGPFKKIANVPNLYRRAASGVYYLLVKRQGRQFRRSLKTGDFALAKRRLREFQGKASKLAGADADKGLLFEDLAQRWLSSIKPDQKSISYTRRIVAVKALSLFFRGEHVTKIGRRQIEQWKTKRWATVAAQTANIETETLRLMFRYAMEDLRVLIENPAAVIKRRKVRSVERLIPTKGDFSRLASELRTGHRATGEAADFVEFLAYSGMMPPPRNLQNFGRFWYAMADYVGSCRQYFYGQESLCASIRVNSQPNAGW